MFLMHKYLTRAHFSDMIKMANRRGRNDKTNDTYFRKASLEQLLKGTHPVSGSVFLPRLCLLPLLICLWLRPLVVLCQPQGTV